MNKPVAWISRLPEGDVYNCAWAEKQNDDDIPLYTHPVKEPMMVLDGNRVYPAFKELTDEEIEEVINRTYWVGTEDEIRMKIARAILRKAQEK